MLLPRLEDPKLREGVLLDEPMLREGVLLLDEPKLRDELLPRLGVLKLREGVVAPAEPKLREGVVLEEPMLRVEPFVEGRVTLREPPPTLLLSRENVLLPLSERPAPERVRISRFTLPLLPPWLPPWLATSGLLPPGRPLLPPGRPLLPPGLFPPRLPKPGLRPSRPPGPPCPCP